MACAMVVAPSSWPRVTSSLGPGASATHTHTHGVPKPATFADGVTKSRMEWAHAELQTRENRKQSNLVSCRLGPSHRGLYVISLHSYRPLPIILPTDCFLPLALPLSSQREHRQACIQLYRDNVADLRLPVCEKSLYL